MLAFAVGFMSCNKIQEPTQEVEDVVDCECDRIVEVSTFNIVGMDGVYKYVLTTINDCTGIQSQEDGTCLINKVPQVGDCY